MQRDIVTDLQVHRKIELGWKYCCADRAELLLKLFGCSRAAWHVSRELGPGDKQLHDGRQLVDKSLSKLGNVLTSITLVLCVAIAIQFCRRWEVPHNRMADA